MNYEVTKLTVQANGLQNAEVVYMNYRLQTTSQMNKKQKCSMSQAPLS